MIEKNENKGIGMGSKIGFFIGMFVAIGFYYIVALNWVLMVPVQNLPYPYK